MADSCQSEWPLLVVKIQLFKHREKWISFQEVFKNLFPEKTVLKFNHFKLDTACQKVRLKTMIILWFRLVYLILNLGLSCYMHLNASVVFLISLVRVSMFCINSPPELNSTVNAVNMMIIKWVFLSLLSQVVNILTNLYALKKTILRCNVSHFGFELKLFIST